MADGQGQTARGGETVPEVPGYRIERLLGRGSMGVVYLAEDVKLNRKVALKILAPTLADDELFRRRFDRESQSAAKLDHPNIVPVYAAGEAAGLLYIAMRYVAGGDLRALLDTNGSLSLEQAVTAIAAVADALDAAHAQGVIHRDVKPANILLDARNSQEHFYLGDFGITKIVSSGRSLTSTGQIVGTIDYLAPEQIQGKPVDGRADLYALGCVLYQCLTGVVPFPRDETAALMWAHVHDEPPPVTARRPDLPPRIDHIVAMAMAKQPEDRYATCRELALALRALTGMAPADSGGQPLPAPPIAGPPPPPVPTGQPDTDMTLVRPRARAPVTASSPVRRRWLVAGCAVLALAVIGGSTAGVLKYLSSGFPNAAEQELLDEVPLALTMKHSCTRNAAAEQDSAQVRASVICTSDGEVNRVVFTRFTSPQALAQHYQANVAAAGVAASSGDCSTAERAEGSYTSDSGQTSGRVLCYQQLGSSFVNWTDSDSRTLGVATRTDADYGKLRSWWEGVVGVKSPAPPSSTTPNEPSPAPSPAPTPPPAVAAPPPPAPEPAPAPAPDTAGPGGAQPGDNGRNPSPPASSGDNSGGAGADPSQNPTTSATPTTPPTTTTTAPPSTSTTSPPTSTTPPQKPPGQLAGPAPPAPGPQQGGAPVPGTSRCSRAVGSLYLCAITQDAPVYLPGATNPSGRIPGRQSEFLCQSDGSKYTFGNRTNHWWAWVGLDNIGGWVPAVFVIGDPNNKPVPGLPVCGSTPSTTETPPTTTTRTTPTRPKVSGR